MNTPYRFIAIDIDGTLVDSSSRLLQANREALHRAHEAGYFICLCTGRCYTEARLVLDDIGLDMDATVCVFGAVVSDARTGRTLHRSTIARPTVRKLLQFFADRGDPVLVLQDAAETNLDYYLVNGSRNVHFYDQWIAVAPTSTERVTAWPDNAPEPLRIGIIETPDRILEVVHDVEATFTREEIKYNSIFAPNYGLHVVECFAPHVNKWHGIMQLAQDHDFEPSQVIAIGDDVNDVEMIRHAGLSVAMGNAIPLVRELARLQTKTNNEAGVAAFLDRLLSGDVPAPAQVC